MVTHSKLLRGRWRRDVVNADQIAANLVYYAMRSVIRMTATALPTLDACSLVSLLQVQQKVLFGGEELTVLIDLHLAFVNMAHHRVRHWRTHAVRTGCMMMSRIETVLNPGIRDGLSP